MAIVARRGETLMKLEGAEELHTYLKQFTVQAEKKILKVGARAAANLVLKDARSHVPKKTGLLKKSLTVRAVRRKRGSKFIGMKVTTAGRAPYAHLVELGTQDRYTKPSYVVENDESRKKGKFKRITGGKRFTGKVKPQPYLAPSLKRNVDACLAKFKEAILATAKKLKANTKNLKG